MLIEKKLTISFEVELPTKNQCKEHEGDYRSRMAQKWQQQGRVLSWAYGKDKDRGKTFPL